MLPLQASSIGETGRNFKEPLTERIRAATNVDFNNNMAEQHFKTNWLGRVPP